eukprot:3650688-Amphidinium_carterae.1
MALSCQCTRSGTAYWTAEGQRGGSNNVVIVRMFVGLFVETPELITCAQKEFYYSGGATGNQHS